MFKFLWLRRLVRRHSTPIPYRKANTWRNRLSIAYALFAWNGLGYLVWQYSKGKLDPEKYGIEKTEYDMLSPAQQFAIGAGIEKAKIIRSSNMQAVDFNLDEFKHLAKPKEPVESSDDNDDDDDDDEDNVA